MQEITWRRTKNSKTFLKEDGSYRTRVRNSPMHYKEDGVWEEITAVPTNDDSKKVSFNELSDSVWVDTDTFCGTLHIENDSYSITVNVAPIVDSIDPSDELLTIAEAGDSETTLSQSVTEHSDFTYTITDRRIKPESTMTTMDAIPDKYAFSISYDGLSVRHSEQTHKIGETEVVNGETVRDETKKESPVQLEFVTDSGEVVYRFTEPVFLDGNGNERHMPLHIETESETAVVGYYQSPPQEWCETAIEETGSLVMDPEVSPGFTFVQNGDTTTHTQSTDNIDIFNQEVRWRGNQDSSTNTDNNTYYNTTSTQVDGSYSTSTTVPSNYSGSATGSGAESYPAASAFASWENRDSGGVECQTSVSNSGNSSSSLIDVDGVTNVEIGSTGGPGSTTNHSYDTTAGTNDGYVDDCYSESRLSSQTSNTTYYYTDNASVTINGDSYSSPQTSLQGGDVSDWVSVTSIVEDENTFEHSIGGSNEADFEFRYDWDYLPPDPPTNLTAEVPGV